MKDAQDKIVVLDFGATCFMPPSFFSLAMAFSDMGFPRLVADQVAWTESPNMHGISRAHYFLVMCQRNNVGKRLSPTNSRTDSYHAPQVFLARPRSTDAGDNLGRLTSRYIFVSNL